MAAAPSAFSSDVYMTIAARLAGLSPSIHIWQHIGDKLCAGRNTLQGISFVAKNVNKLLLAFRSAKDNDGNQAFAEGSKKNPQFWDPKPNPTDNWALQMSYAETHGIGFREIWRPHLSNRPLAMDDGQSSRFHPKWKGTFAANFDDSTQSGSSIHAAIAPDICNIHIDERGFVMTGLNGEVIVDPDFAQHTVNELLLKTKLDGKLPDWLIDRLSIQLPNSSNEYSRIGASFDLAQKKDYRIRWTASCSVLGQVDCSTTVTISGTHNILGSK